MKASMRVKRCDRVNVMRGVAEGPDPSSRTTSETRFADRPKIPSASLEAGVAPRQSQPSSLLWIETKSRLHALCLLVERRLKRWLARIELFWFLHALHLLPTNTEKAVALELGGYADRLIAAEALSHVHHSFLAITEASLQLLTLGRKSVIKFGGEALERGMTIDQDAIGLLQTCRQSVAYMGS